MIEDEANERLSALAKRYAEINGWNEAAILQFAITAMSKSDIETKLQYLEKHISMLEQERQIQKEKSEQKQAYISYEEREKCRKVVNAYAEELDNVGIMVLDAGRYGFIKLINYKFPYGFDEAIAYINSIELFIDLWEEWLTSQLISLTGDMAMSLDNEDMLKYLSKDKQNELMAKKEYFSKKADIQID